MTETDPTADEWQFVQQAHYDPDERRDLTTAIICAIAAVEGVAPDEVKEPNLYECVDVAAIEDSFFGPEVGGQNRDSNGSVVFRFDEYRVEVASDGWITVSESTAQEDQQGVK